MTQDTRFQDKIFGPCEICERDRELGYVFTDPRDGYVRQRWLCWECLGEPPEPCEQSGE